MIAPIKTVADTPASTADRRGEGDQQATPAPAAKPTQTVTQDEPLRLVVEPVAGSAQGYTYKLFDRATGALLIELPRETAAQLSESPTYSAGQVFNAKA